MPQVNEFELDLDSLAPQSKYIKLKGETLEVFPPTVKLLLELFAAQKKLRDANEPNEVTAGLESVKNVLVNIMPALKRPDIDLSFGQMSGLIEFVLGMATPDDAKVLKEHGITPAQAEKKTESAPDTSN